MLPDHYQKELQILEDDIVGFQEYSVQKRLTEIFAEHISWSSKKWGKNFFKVK